MKNLKKLLKKLEKSALSIYNIQEQKRTLTRKTVRKNGGKTLWQQKIKIYGYCLYLFWLE